MATAKKITKVGGDNPTPQSTSTNSNPLDKGKAGQLRFFAILAWILAIIAEAGAIYVLLTGKEPIMVWLIALIVVDLIFAIAGNLLWKKSNRYDPASRKDKVKFFIQNQLGVIVTAIAFLPLIILIFTNKDLSGNQKKTLGGIAIVAVLIAGYLGIDFNPTALEDQTGTLSGLTGGNTVFWTNSGKKYHIYNDCSSINRDVTTEIFEGTLETAYNEKKINELCKICENRAEKAKNMSGNILPEELEEDDSGGNILDNVLDLIGN